MSISRQSQMTPLKARREAHIRQLAGEHNYAGIGRQMGMRPEYVRLVALKAGIKVLTLAEVGEPTYGEWLGMASEKAAEAGVPVLAVLSALGPRRAVRARWSAWRAILDSNPDFSIAGVARVSGWHHTTIMNGLARLAGAAAKPRRPK